jgi:hypothetical protein
MKVFLMNNAIYFLSFVLYAKSKLDLAALCLISVHENEI